MKSKRSLLFKVGAILLLLVIAALMMIIGRGHTIYLDNKSIDYDGKTYETPYKVVVLDGEEQLAKLYDGERGMTTCIGQQFTITLEITQTKGGSEEIVPVTLTLPYNIDGIIINLPAYLAGLPEEAYYSEFIPTPEEVEETEEPGVEGEMEVPTEDFALGDI